MATNPTNVVKSEDLAAVEPKKSAADTLAEILLQEKAEQAQARAVSKEKLAEADARRRGQDADKLAKEQRKYGNCDHLQGNHRIGTKPFREIGALSLHTFGGPSTKDTRRIRCNKCGHKWYPGDKRKVYGANSPYGEGIANPTKWGWKEAYDFCLKFQAQGNKPSAGFVEVVVAPPVGGYEEEDEG